MNPLRRIARWFRPAAPEKPAHGQSLAESLEAYFRARREEARLALEARAERRGNVVRLPAATVEELFGLEPGAIKVPDADGKPREFECATLSWKMAPEPFTGWPFLTRPGNH